MKAVFGCFADASILYGYYRNLISILHKDDPYWKIEKFDIGETNKIHNL